MPKTLTVFFDGQVLRPEEPVDLTPNARYLITIQAIPPAVKGESAWDVLESLAGTVEAPPDWAQEHDHYLYGTPKRHGGGKSKKG
ncbi:MAG: hypothetical protein ACETWB_09665 [Anaerolineae bacterium]